MEIQSTNNRVEFGFFIELAACQLSLTAIRATPQREAHIILSCITDAGEETTELSAEAFLLLVKEKGPLFLEALGL